MIKRILTVTVATAALSLTACNATNPIMGGGSGHTVTGAASGANAQGNNSQLAHCDEPLGTMAVYEDHNKPWWAMYTMRYPQLGSTIPVVRLMIQQSNCFVVIERGRAMSSMNTERQLQQSGEMRSGSRFGKGQMVAADYTLNPSIHFAAKGTGGVGSLVGGLVRGSVGALIGGRLKRNEASTTLLLIDNRSGVQIAAAVGNAKNWDLGFGGLFGRSGIGGVGGFSNTPEGKLISAAFADSYNHMVNSLRNYQAQQVKGGLGKGGKLKVGS